MRMVDFSSTKQFESEQPRVDECWGPASCHFVVPHSWDVALICVVQNDSPPSPCVRSAPWEGRMWEKRAPPFLLSQEGFFFKEFTYHEIYPLQMYNSVVFSVFTRLCSHHHSLIVEHCHHPKKKPWSQSLSIPPSPSPWQSQITFYVWICLFWTFNVNWIVQYVAFCGWPLSLSAVSSRVIHVVARIRASSLSMAE